MGPAVGAVDIGGLEDAYYFRVTLTGVSSDKRNFSCDIEPDGKGSNKEDYQQLARK
ncbi:hypothetical protein PTKIN_Ptkin01aG0323600 [Pterospermum kingtungense]